MLYSRLFTLLFAFSLVALVGCTDSDTDEAALDDDMTAEGADDMTMAEPSILVVAEDAGLTTFRTGVAQANLDGTLSGPGPYTVFAPSDEAFNALPEGTLESLLETGNRDELTDLLTYHVLSRKVMSGELSGELSVSSMQGQPLTITANGGTVTLTDGQGNTATVVTADMEAGNGVIHVIDTVLMPGAGETDETMEDDDAM